MQSLAEKVIADVQDGLTDLTKALHELTLTISAHKGESDTMLATLNLEIKYLRAEVEVIKIEQKEKTNKISDRIFEIVKLLLPAILAGAVAWIVLAVKKG